MNVPMDEPSSRVIEFKAAPSKAMVEVKERDFSERECDHANFQVDDKNRTVECGKCKRQLDPMHVLVLVAYSERRRRYMIWQQEEHARKESEKTIKAAVIALAHRKVDPSKFAELYKKYISEDIASNDTKP